MSRYHFPTVFQSFPQKVLRLTLLAAALMVFSVATVTAQPPADLLPPTPLRFERLSLDAGLSQNAVFPILQDSRGLMWFGTQDGLNRYDGYTFTVYRHEPDNPNSLSHSSILALAEDASGMLWIGTWGGGLNRLDPATGQFTHYRYNPADPAGLSHDLVAALYADKNGLLWMGTMGGGLDRLDPATGKFEHFKHNPADPASLSSDYISTIFEDAAGSLWIGTGGYNVEGNGLNRFDQNTGAFEHFQHNPNDPATLSGNTISAIDQDAAGMLWIGAGGYGLPGNGLNRLDPKTGQITRFSANPDNPASLNSNDVVSVKVDSTGGLWVGTWGGGLNRMARTDVPGEFVQYRHNPLDDTSLSADIIWSIFEDRSGVLWIGTINGGLNKLNPQVQRFRHYRHDPDNPASLGFNVIGPFYEDSRGGLWIGTWGGGLDFFDRATGQFTHYRHNPDDPASLAEDTVTRIYEDETGALWVGCMDGLNRLDPATGKFTHFRHDPNNPDSLAHNSAFGIIGAGAGRLWLGTMDGLDLFDPATGRATHYRHNPDDPASLINNQVVELYYDSTGVLWIGTWGGGMSRLDPGNYPAEPARFINYRHHPADTTSLSDDNVWAIYEDSAGTLWVGTQAGLNKLDRQKQTFTHYWAADGLPNNTIIGIIEEINPANGALWFSTNHGLSRFDPATETFRNYDAQDGLQSNEFNSSAAYRAKNGDLFFGGINGFNVFRPEQIQDNPAPPPMVVTRFSVFNQPISADLSGKTPIELSYRENFISFEFAALDYHAPKKNQYAYKLEGFDPDWVEAGARRYAGYTNLPGGNYVFKVKGSNNDGVWNETGVAIPLKIMPPLWATWWFKGSLVLLFLAVTGGVYSWRIFNIKKQNAALERVVTERTTELRRAQAELAKRAEEKLSVSEARFQAMFDNAAVGIVLMTLDRRVIGMNQACQQILGYSFEEMAQIDPASLSHPDDMDIGKDLFTDMLQGKRPEGYRIEKRYRHKNGHYIWVRLTYSLVPDKDGNPEYRIGVLENIDEQKRAGEKIAAQEAEYRRTLEHHVKERTRQLAETNNRLVEEINQRKQIEKTLARKAADEAVVAERTRLARDLHDAVTQTLFSASLTAEVLPELWAVNPVEAEKTTEELRQLTRSALAEMRTLLLELRPSALTEARLEDLLRQLTEAIVGRARLPVQFTVDGQRQLPVEVKITFYRIAQEALNNVVKYARAGQVYINLRLQPETARLVISDDGGGFDPAKIKPTHLGLKIMRERAETIGARLAIHSEIGHGTIITVTWTDPEREAQ